MVQQNLSIAPPPTSPWIEPKTGQPTAPFYRFIVHFLTLAGGGSTPATLEELESLIFSQPEISPGAVANLEAAVQKLAALGQLTSPRTPDLTDRLQAVEFLSLLGLNPREATKPQTQYQSATVLVAAAVPLTNNVPADVTHLALGAGVYDVSGNVVFPVGNATNFSAWISTVSAALPTLPNGGAYTGIAMTANLTAAVLPIGPARLTLTTAEDVYLSVYSSFTGSNSAYGFIQATPVR